MDDNKQCLLLDYLISSPDTYALCQGIIKPEYFVPELRQCVDFIQGYYEDYSTTPSVKQIEAESGVELEVTPVTEDQIAYVSTEVETFCKRRAMELAFVNGMKFVNTDDYGKAHKMIEEALEVSLNKDLGVRYFETVEERLERMMKETPTMSTGWNDVDDLLFGGISRKELLLVAANSGGGKSICLANLAAQNVEAGRTVLYISLELSEDIVAQRFDTMFTGIGRKEWKTNVSEITTRLESERARSGTLDIKYMPGGTCAADIRAYLKEYYLKFKVYPDLMVVDYLDEMSPNEKVSADNIHEKDKRCTGQVRQIGVDFNMATATASQLNRGAVDTLDHNHSHIAGGISKINICDTFWSIILTDIMKAKGECMFKLQKTRNSDGVGKTIHLKWDAKYLRIRDGDGSRPPSMEAVEESTVDTGRTPNKPGSGLFDLMDS